MLNGTQVNPIFALAHKSEGCKVCGVVLVYANLERFGRMLSVPHAAASLEAEVPDHAVDVRATLRMCNGHGQK